MNEALPTLPTGPGRVDAWVEKPADTAAGVAEARRWYWQRISAMVLAVAVVVHIATVIYAVRGGLSAAEILGRTRGSWTFGIFYSIFVIACAVHVPIGLANIAHEWWSLGERAALWLARAFALLLLVMGLAAVAGVVMP